MKVAVSRPSASTPSHRYFCSGCGLAALGWPRRAEPVPERSEADHQAHQPVERGEHARLHRIWITHFALGFHSPRTAPVGS